VKPVVIKLGGSLLNSPRLVEWLEVLTEHGAGRAVIVPGGGRYADAVRAAQSGQGMAEATAHQRAMEAMQYMVGDLIAIAPSLKPADSIRQAREVLAAGSVAAAVAINDWQAADDIPASWDWTSDSLALWLARAMRVEKMLLVKSVMPPADTASAPAISRQGIIDAAFPALLGDCEQPVFWAGPAQARLLPRWLEGQESVYCRLIADSSSRVNLVKAGIE